MATDGSTKTFVELQTQAPKGKLVLKDGTEMHGFSFGAEKSISGEVVFNTGMVGYPESLSDASYRGQILVITFPLIGNYGVPSRDQLDEFGLPEFFESNTIQAAGVIVSDYSFEHSHYASTSSLQTWLKECGVPGLFGIDTRELTKILRISGSMLGKVIINSQDVPFDDPLERNLCAEVSCKEPKVYGDGKLKIVAVDCGIKNNIIRYLVRYKNVAVKVVPWDHDLSSEDCDGVFLSNGPGNPEKVSATIENIRKLLARNPPVPIFGICMGHQLLSLAAGATTYKMKFGNRGMNQPVIDQRTMRCYITPQNHGFAVDENSLPSEWAALFYNANDFSNEGITHLYKPFFSVQFHPEAMGGPTDTDFLFDTFLNRVGDGHARITTMPPDMRSRNRANLQKVLLLGSGGLSIGQAGEFDYSGSQAIKALKEQNVKVILVNPNIATVQTSDGMADETYFEPVTPEFVTKVIERERPQGLLLQFGGQTALNCGIKLRDMGILEKYNVAVLGTPVDTIVATEDREIFAKKLEEVNERVAPSRIAYTVEEALEAGETLGYPVLVRAAFALGGLGSGFAANKEEMLTLVKKSFSLSNQLIVDKSCKGWKEVEYEVVRDCMDNCITVCNMENFDPLGVHTGDSIVVAPSQTLTNEEYYMLRRTAIKVVRHLGVVGECNIQYALNPDSKEFFIIEVNARLSRSSALASKATGYPLAYVACKLALGAKLTDVMNSVTKSTTACFEPSLDYCVVKIPRWDMRKFQNVSTAIGSAMKSVGEVMAIGRKFEETFQKAMRMVDSSVDGFGDLASSEMEMRWSKDELENVLLNPSDRRIFAIQVAFHRGYSVEQVHQLTRIDRWFLHKLQNILHVQQALQLNGGITNISKELLLLAKQTGFSDKGVARCCKTKEMEVRAKRLSLGLMPVAKQIDTLAAEFPATTNYLYLTYNGSHSDVTFDEHGVMVLGCGAYRIGSSCEFDWCAVSCIRTLRKLGIKSIVVNYNPETVSTDYDESDRLYFEELSLEIALDIYQLETAQGVVVSVGGQIPNNLVIPLSEQGVRILGTSAESIDSCEDRDKFSSLCDRLGIDQPKWMAATSKEEAKVFAQRVQYPVLVRPSYVLSGAAMRVVATEEALMNCLDEAAKVSLEHPVVISKFIERAKEIEMDAVANKGMIVNYAISEHVENAGVHSGDATLVLPGQKLYVETVRRIKHITSQICRELNITGPVNIQFLSKANDIKVIECNLRASRSFPFISKTFNMNFIELATRAMVEAPVSSVAVNLYETDFCCVKSPMFSFTRLQGADPITRVEMASTGEVACFGVTQHEALLKSMFATGFKLPKEKRTILLALGPTQTKTSFQSYARSLANMGYTLYATAGTHTFYSEEGITTQLVEVRKGESQPVIEMIKEKVFELLIVCPGTHKTDTEAHTEGYAMRRAAVDLGIPLITNLKLAQALVQALERVDVDKMQVRSWKDFVVAGHRVAKVEHIFTPTNRDQSPVSPKIMPWSKAPGPQEPAPCTV